jgi:trimeric autotransporter adhesin
VNPSFTVSATAVTVTPGATTGNASTITVTPSGGFTGSVVMTGVLTSSPVGAQYPPTMSFGSTSPVSISGTTAGTATVTISTTSPTSGALVHPKPPGVPWYISGGAALACFLLFGVPARRRTWQTMLGALMLFVTLAGGAIACGGSSGNSGGGGGGGTSNSGTTAGTYTVTVTGTSGVTTAAGTVSLTVK